MPRGGKRTGAGRHTKDEISRHSLTLTLREDILSALRAQAAEQACSLSDLANNILLTHFQSAIPAAALRSTPVIENPVFNQTPVTPGQPLVSESNGLAFYDQLLKTVDEVDRHLAETALEDSDPVAPGQPLSGQVQELREKLTKEVRLFMRTLDTRPDLQKLKTAGNWSRVLKEEPAVQAAMARLNAFSPQLAELMKTGQAFRHITPRDVSALVGLAEADQIQMLLYLMQRGCSDRAEFHLGELGVRFRQAWLQQPERAPQSWKLKPVPRKHKAESAPPVDEDQYKRDMLSAIEELYERLYPKEGKPGNLASARARKSIPVIAALRLTHYHKLYQLLVADLLPVSESELHTLSGLNEKEQRLALWTLIHSRTQQNIQLQ